MEIRSKRVIQALVGVLVLVVGIYLCGQMITTVGADEIVVKQNVFDGKLQVWSTPGMHWQMFGRVTRYKKSAQYWFSADKSEGKTEDESIKVRFNDGGHGNVSGSVRYDLPLDEPSMIKLHSTFGSMEAIDRQLIRQVVNKAVYMSGPLMSSRESYAEKRSELINYITDQILHGVYKTDSHEIVVKDLISGIDKTVSVVGLTKGDDAGFARQEKSPIEELNLRAYNLTINGILYDPQVEEQIKQQQQATMAVQQAMVDARKAEQNSITVAKQGEAKAMEAKWVQEVEKAKAVTAAEQAKAVAELDLETARLKKQQEITTAEGQSEAKKLIMTADGNLTKKLDAWVEVNKAYAAELGKQRWVPDIVMGGAFGPSGGTAIELMQLLQVKTARDLALEVGMTPAKK